MAGGDAPGHGQARLAVGVQVRVIDRIAVDGGIVMGRHVAGGGHVLGQDAAERLAQRHVLRADDAGDAPGQDRERVVHGHQAAVKGEAIVLKLRHG